MQRGCSGYMEGVWRGCRGCVEGIQRVFRGCMQEYRMLASCVEWYMDWLLGSQRVRGWHAEGCTGERG